MNSRHKKLTEINREYLTNNENKIFSASSELKGLSEEEIKNGNRNYLLPSLEVAGTGTFQV